MEYQIEREEVELATPTDTNSGQLEMFSVPIPAGDYNHFTNEADEGLVGLGVCGDDQSHVGSDKQTEVEPMIQVSTGPFQKVQLQALEEPQPGQNPAPPVAHSAYPDQEATNVEDMYAVPIRRSEHPQEGSQTDVTGATYCLRDPATIFDDPGYMRGMMVRSKAADLSAVSVVPRGSRGI